MLLCDALAHVLEALEVRAVFGISGANIEAFHDALHRLDSQQTKSILTKSESGAAFMADGYARANNSLGVCCATSGGGMMNLAVGIAESQASGVPVLAIVGQVPIQMEGRGGFQDSSGLGGSIYATGMWRSITQYTACIRRADDFWQALNQCLTASLNGRRGATALLIPNDIQTAPVGPMPEWFASRLERGFIDHTSADGVVDLVARLSTLLRTARHPLVILGEAAVRSTAYDAVLSFIEQSGIAVATTLSNIAACDTQVSSYVGCLGACGEPGLHRYVEEQVDLVVAIGTSLDQMAIGPLVSVLANKPLVAVHQDISLLNTALSPSLVIAAPLDQVFDALSDQLDLQPLRFDPPASYQRIRHDVLAAEPTTGLSNSQAVNAINPFIPDGSHLIFDAGNCAATAAHYLEPPASAQASIALGMGGMGYGVASAIGVAMAKKYAQSQLAPTIVFCGDGAFLMNGMEVHTAIELKLPILWVVFNNQGHGMCSSRQALLFNNRVNTSQFSNAIDIARMCEGLGTRQNLIVAKAQSTDDIAEFMQAYHTSSMTKPAVLELAITIDEVPPFAPLIEAFETQQLVSA